MTRADIEAMLNELATTTRDLQVTGVLVREAADKIVDSSRLMREAAEHISTVSDHLKEIGDRTSAAITAGLSALHGDDHEA